MNKLFYLRANLVDKLNKLADLFGIDTNKDGWMQETLEACYHYIMANRS